MTAYEFQAMDTLVEMEGTNSTISDEWKGTIHEWYQKFEGICSRFQSTSDLSKLNQAEKNIVVQVHPVLYELLEKALHYAEQTDFYFNPFIGSALNDLGYNKTFSEIQYQFHNPKVIADTVTWNEAAPILFLPTIHGVIKEVDLDIDLGGIAKGWSVDKVAAHLKNAGLTGGIVNAGGDMFVWGETERTIGIAHPAPNFCDKDILQFNIRNGGVATSNTLHRSWSVGENRVHHILNGQSGLPAESEIVQATVFAGSTTEADVLAKVLCMLPFSEAILWLHQHFPTVGCILINGAGKLAVSPYTSNYINKVVM